MTRIIAFDPDYHLLLWRNHDKAAFWINECYKLGDSALPGLEDEQMLFADADVDTVMSRLGNLNVQEIVVKAGDKGMFGYAAEGSYHIPFTPDFIVGFAGAIAPYEEFMATIL